MFGRNDQILMVSQSVHIPAGSHRGSKHKPGRRFRPGPAKARNRHAARKWEQAF
jgi:hypothetical protein